MTKYVVKIQLKKLGSGSSNKRETSVNDRTGSSVVSKKSKSGSSSNVGTDRGQSHGGRTIDRGSSSSGSVGVTSLGRDGTNISDRGGGIAGVITEHGGGRHHHDKVLSTYFIIIKFMNFSKNFR